jgi:hypothetical protein
MSRPQPKLRRKTKPSKAVAKTHPKQIIPTHADPYGGTVLKSRAIDLTVEYFLILSLFLIVGLKVNQPAWFSIFSLIVSGLSVALSILHLGKIKSIWWRILFTILIIIAFTVLVYLGFDLATEAFKTSEEWYAFDKSYFHDFCETSLLYSTIAVVLLKIIK